MEKTIRLYFCGQRESGAFVYNDFINVNEDFYSMNEVVRKIREKGYISFALETMKRLFNIKEG